MAAVDDVQLVISALHAAVISGDVGLVTKIVTPSNVNLTTADSFSMTPLTIACMSNNIEMFMFLLTVPKIDLNGVDSMGNTPAHYAANVGNVDMLNYLRAQRGLLDVPNKQGETPIFYALKEPDACMGNGTPDKHHPALAFLLSNNVVLTTVNHKKRTPLWTAYELGDRVAFSMICIHILDVRHAHTSKRWSPARAMAETHAVLDWEVDGDILINSAVAKKRYDNLRHLLLAEARPNQAFGPEKILPLQIAINALDPIAMEILLRNGACPTALGPNRVIPIEQVYGMANDGSSITRKDSVNITNSPALKAAILLFAAGASDPIMMTGRAGPIVSKPHVSLLEMAAIRNNPCLVCLSFMVNFEYSLMDELEMMRMVSGALEHQYEDVAEMLLLFGPRLAGLRNARGESVAALAAKFGCRKLAVKLPALNAARQAPLPTGPTEDPYMHKIQIMKKAQQLKISKHEWADYSSNLDLPNSSVPGYQFETDAFELTDMVNAIIQ